MERIVNIFLNSESFVGKKHKNFIGHFLHGLMLKSYEFKKYKTKKDNRIISINVLVSKKNLLLQNQLKFKAIRRRNFLCKRFSFRTRKYSSPDEYAKRLNTSKKRWFKNKYL